MPYEPTAEEEAAIQRGIDQDPDNPEITDEQWARMRPAIEVVPHLVEEYLRRTRGQQPAPPRQRVALSLDRDVVDRLRQGGRGWQGRANALLRRAVLGE